MLQKLEKKYGFLLNVIRRFLHIILIAHNIVAGVFYVLYGIEYNESLEDKKMFHLIASSFYYVDFLNLILHVVYCSYSSVLDFYVCIHQIDENCKDEECQKVSEHVNAIDYIESVILFPITFVVPIIYILQHFNLVMHPNNPIWLVHMTHTNLAIFQIIETVLGRRRYPTLWFCIFGILSEVGIYIFWMHVINYFSGLWVYKFYGSLQASERIGVIVLLLVFFLIMFFIGKYANHFLWHKVEEPEHDHDVHKEKSFLARSSIFCRPRPTTKGGRPQKNKRKN